MPRRRKVPGAAPALVQSAEVRAAAGILANQPDRAQEAKELACRDVVFNELGALYRSLDIPCCSRPIWRFAMRVVAEIIVEVEDKLFPPTWRLLDEDSCIEMRISDAPLEPESEVRSTFGVIQ